MPIQKFYITENGNLLEKNYKFLRKLQKLRGTNGYELISVDNLINNRQLFVYNINNSGLLFYKRTDKSVRKFFGDIVLFSKFKKDIIKTKEDLEQKTEFKLEGIK